MKFNKLNLKKYPPYEKTPDPSLLHNIDFIARSISI